MTELLSVPTAILETLLAEDSSLAVEDLPPNLKAALEGALSQQNLGISALLPFAAPGCSAANIQLNCPTLQVQSEVVAGITNSTTKCDIRNATAVSGMREADKRRRAHDVRQRLANAKAQFSLQGNSKAKKSSTGRARAAPLKEKAGRLAGRD